MSSEHNQLQEVPIKEIPIPLLLIVKQDKPSVKDPSTQQVISLSSDRVEMHDVHSDLDMEEDHATNPEDFLTTLLSSIPRSPRSS